MYELRDNGYSILEQFFKQKAENRMNDSLVSRCLLETCSSYEMFASSSCMTYHNEARDRS